MKYFLITLSTVFFFTSCTTRDPFGTLKLNPEQKKAIEHTQSGKIMKEKLTQGLYGAVYLNNSDKKTLRENHEFYLSIYLKKNNELNITMNGQKALDIQQLSAENEYKSLLPTQTKWASYYLLSFEDKQSKELILKIDSGPFSSGPLKYLRD